VNHAQTRKLRSTRADHSLASFRAGHRAALVVLSGPAAGNEHELDREKLSIGRGPGVDLAFEDASMSREHAVLEFSDDGFRIRDLASTNGVAHNGETVQVASLVHGDRLQLGEHRFQYICDDIPVAPETYVVEED